MRRGHAARYVFLLPLLLLACPNVSMAADLRLLEAVRTGNRSTIQALIQQRVDVNASEPDGTTALHWAVRLDDSQTVAQLIRAGQQGRQRQPLRRDSPAPGLRQRQRGDRRAITEGGS